MDTSNHNLTTLFEQLGLDGTRSGIYHFVKEHRIPDDMTIDEASFWTDAQRSFLRDSLDTDGDWSEIVDQLDAMLRK
ncbi:DUF2789 domain-containing protein [Psychrosphaera ytuae]|uniref:DUF2789 domain-containing protein n=1 Tax=Psychrosphaera ytuae TaxID=2820710 RepID=A0A975DB96_9GAMM|nr:DUF2789 domain-containing protein [Psychrosphaera ytuae]QTH63951.1 DUF2789 domain-containing protein [Psychrosphaera ytuae]